MEETQRDAIQNVTFPNLPSDPNEFKTAAMFNFGVKATSALYPASAAAGVIKSASAHLFILGVAQTLSLPNIVQPLRGLVPN